MFPLTTSATLNTSPLKERFAQGNQLLLLRSHFRYFGAIASKSQTMHFLK
ncbi:hypothetical protein [Nostoc sp.]